MNVTKMVSQHSNEARINESCTSRNLVLSVSSFFESDCNQMLGWNLRDIWSRGAGFCLGEGWDYRASFTGTDNFFKCRYVLTNSFRLQTIYLCTAQGISSQFDLFVFLIEAKTVATAQNLWYQEDRSKDGENNQFFNIFFILHLFVFK